MRRLAFSVQMLLSLLGVNAQQTQAFNESPFVTIPLVVKDIQNSNSINEIQKIYYEFLKKYPKEKFGQVYFLTDQVYSAVSKKFLENNDRDVLLSVLKITDNSARRKLMELIPSKFWKSQMADSIDKIFKITQKNKVQKPISDQYIYADFLSFKNSYRTTKKFLDKIDPKMEYTALHPYLYADVFMNSGRYNEGIAVLAAVVASGRADQYAKDKLKKYWMITHKASENSYEAYYESLMNQIRTDKSTYIQDKQVNYKAPEFSLFNLEGEKINLKNLKGKVVFIDFWATWCGPCIAAFPAMKNVLNHYSNNKNVVFLFINTMDDKDENRAELLKTFLNSRNFNFNVLMDVKTNKGNYEAASLFKVEGLPSQFIIDKLGNVCFTLKGFDGGFDGTVEELKLMIDTLLAY